jgi:hypothetical protein
MQHQPNGWQTVPSRKPRVVHSETTPVVDGVKPRMPFQKKANFRDKTKYNNNKKVAASP